MKYQRQAEILELVEKYDIETQDDLLEKLKEEGFQATQATVSRDIREMNLTKVSVPGARQKYAVEKNNRYETLDSYKKVLSTGIISVDAAEPDRDQDNLRCCHGCSGSAGSYGY